MQQECENYNNYIKLKITNNTPITFVMYSHILDKSQHMIYILAALLKISPVTSHCELQANL